MRPGSHPTAAHFCIRVAIRVYPQPSCRNRRARRDMSAVASTIRRMWGAFVGTEAINDGLLTRGQLRWNFTAVHPGVYAPDDAERTLALNTVAAWLWTGRKGVIAGRAAAALHGAKWVDAT